MSTEKPTSQRGTALDFHGRVAVVTGAGTGLGRNYALALAQRGATVVVNDLHPCGRSDAPAQRPVTEEIIAKGGRASWLQGDVSDARQAAAMIEQVVTEHGRIDILINNAGVQRTAPFCEQDMEDFATVIRVHLLGSANMTRAAWPSMLQKRFGRVVMTTSSSVFGSVGQAAYSAAKAGLIGLVNTLGLEGRDHGIRVNAISPCARAHDLEGHFPEPFLQAMDPWKVAQAVVFLCSETAPQRCVLYAGGGGLSTLRLFDSGGIFIAGEASAEDIMRRFEEIDPASRPEFDNVYEHITRFNAQLGIPTR